MANKKDLKSSMAAGITGGLDSLIQPTAAIQEPEQPKKEKAVHCNFVINQSIHTRLKTLAIRKGVTLKMSFRKRLWSIWINTKNNNQKAHKARYYKQAD